MNEPVVDRRVRKTKKNTPRMSDPAAKVEKNPGYHRPGADGNGGFEPRNLLSSL